MARAGNNFFQNHKDSWTQKTNQRAVNKGEGKLPLE